MNHQKNSAKVIGQTQSVGFQIGARKTFNISPEMAWEKMTSHDGFKLWLGDVTSFSLVPGKSWQASDGTTGQIRVVNPGSHFRFTWQPPDWPKPSTIQVRIIPSGAKTVISFHQEQLPCPDERDQRRIYWKKVLAELDQWL